MRTICNRLCRSGLIITILILRQYKLHLIQIQNFNSTFSKLMLHSVDNILNYFKVILQAPRFLQLLRQFQLQTMVRTLLMVHKAPKTTNDVVTNQKAAWTIRITKTQIVALTRVNERLAEAALRWITNGMVAMWWTPIRPIRPRTERELIRVYILAAPPPPLHHLHCRIFHRLAKIIKYHRLISKHVEYFTNRWPSR